MRSRVKMFFNYLTAFALKIASNLTNYPKMPIFVKKEHYYFRANVKFIYSERSIVAMAAYHALRDSIWNI